ncbi:glucan endo-1,3-beta-glucosidase 6-like [Spinacia oleracea]|uniref:Glucan endo-1,3-beta-glucosidase 6-like n=1 Tax=Spinacia oleracea TaxID=3562 RepID=A0ABM3RNL2_SPIOL|nr:glucan endo-1,3-beta-glucosidase 6-like [Spinacia oleracea]
MKIAGLLVPKVVLLLLLLLLSVIIENGEADIGVNWGTYTIEGKPPTKVVELLKQNNISKVKLFDVEPNIMNALKGSGIDVMVGIPNGMLSLLSSSPKAARSWVRHNLIAYVSAKTPTNIRYVAVGNEHFPGSYSGKFQSYVCQRFSTYRKRWLR